MPIQFLDKNGCSSMLGQKTGKKVLCIFEGVRVTLLDQPELPADPRGCFKEQVVVRP